MRLVMKFGGALMEDAEQIANSADLVAERAKKGDEVVITVSAMSGVTDELIEMGEHARLGDMEKARELLSKLERRHQDSAKKLCSEEILDATSKKIGALIETLNQCLTGVFLLRELTPRSRDLLLSFGERLSAPLMRSALLSRGVKAIDLTGGEAGIITDSNYGNAKPLLNITEVMVKDRIMPVLKAGVVPVVTGFIGQDQNGVITTLGRGGSDYTATILAASLEVDEVWIWKDVDGIMTADPKLVEGAKTIPVLSYLEVMEMAYFGAKVLHPLTVTPVQERLIPIRIRSAYNPSNPGTLIRERSVPKPTVKAITAIKGMSIITTGGAGMIGVPSVVARVFSTLAANGINVAMISQSSSQANISMIVRTEDLEKALKALKIEFRNGDLVRDIHAVPNVAIVAIVGEGMRGAKGVAARLFSAVAEAGVNILMISQGSSELNISFAVQDEDMKKAVVAIHSAFQLDKFDEVAQEQKSM
ncbi:MAG: aspartate kinase [Candidatus Verstraetearchaeota archaeon]|nr:aspartate kinase [Candidatus Verstraetearchaeota archaeon]